MLVPQDLNSRADRVAVSTSFCGSGKRLVMRILIVSQFCPPEVAAGGSRVYENAERWSRAGHKVTILTGLPNHPSGKVLPGYRWRLVQREMRGQVTVVRVGSLVAPNTSTRNRLRAYLSLMMAQILFSVFAGRADVVIGTSPPLFTAFAAYAISVLKRCPFVFDVRDLWPENMVAVGALHDGLSLKMMARLESFLYRKAKLIAPVTRGFERYIRDKGVASERIRVSPNGVDRATCQPVQYPHDLARKLEVEGKTVVAYIGTIGINQGLGLVLDAAAELRDCPDVAFLIVGDGAERELLEKTARKRRLANVRFVGERPREEMQSFHALADVLLIVLQKADYFRMVMPSKLLVAMAMGRPVLASLEGEAQELIEATGSGVVVEPRDPHALAEAVRRLHADKAAGRLRKMGANGRKHVLSNFDRDILAEEYCRQLLRVALNGRAAS